ncbi:hypothetical protein LENED_006184 [Lentinula edodes]|uniref:Uncharacterized protein n=1 Tax=Lentinula edodes TaxID=5353 RepID=A0A1Q3EAZ2_LENED|nr:hypothetical protein LENED_006184 [Lentinula edodes]
MGTNTSTSQSSITIDEPSPPSSFTDTTTSSISSGVAGKLPKKNLIILEPPRILSPPPAYDEPSHQRPITVRHTSVPSLPSSQPYPTEVPPRPATTANDSRTVDSRRNNTDTNPRGLDPIDELDESNPLGLSLHHGGPYEAIKKVTQTPREPQNPYNKSIPQQAAHVSTQKHPSQLGVRARADLFDAEPAQPPSPLLSVPQRFEDDASSIYGDEADAYDGIEDEEISQDLDNPTSEILHQPESFTHFKSAPDMPQTYIDNATAIEDDVARALYTGFSAFGEGPPISDGREAFSRSVPVPTLPPGASYRPPPRRHEQQGRPLEYPEEQTPYTPYVTANQPDGVWHRRATSLDPDYNLHASCGEAISATSAICTSTT